MLDTNMDAGGVCLTQVERKLSYSPHSPMTCQVDSPEPTLELQHNSLLSAYECRDNLPGKAAGEGELGTALRFGFFQDGAGAYATGPESGGTYSMYSG